MTRINHRLIRTAIALYPPDWRRRYGAELEQLVTDALADSSRRFSKAWLIAEVAGSGVRERMRDRGVGRKHRIAGAGATAVVATAAVILFTGGSQGTTPIAPATPRSMSIAPDAHLSNDVMTVKDTSLHGTKGLQHILLEVDPKSGTLATIGGVPSAVRLNPHTAQVVAVKPSSKH